MSWIINQKLEENYIFSKCSLPVVFLRDIHKGHYLTLKDPDEEQSKLVNRLKLKRRCKSS